jgi:hypothetical protein
MAAPAISSFYGSTGRQAFVNPGAATTTVNPDVTLPATGGVSTITNTTANRWPDVATRTINVTHASGSTVVVGSYYGMGFPATAMDFTDDDGSVIEVSLNFSGVTPLQSVANRGLSALFGTQGGGWQHVAVGGNNLSREDVLIETRGGVIQGSSIIFAPGGDPDHLIGQSSFNPANVNYFAILFRYPVTPTVGAASFSLMNALVHGTYRIIEGEVGNPARLKVISDQELNTISLGAASFKRAGEGQYVSYRSLSIGNGTNLVYFVEAFSLELSPDNKTNNAFHQVPDAYQKFSINLTDTSTCDIAGSRIVAGRGLTFTVTRIGTATTSFDRLTVDGGGGRGTMTLLAEYEQTLGLFSSLNTITLNGATLNDITVTNVERVNLTSAATWSGNYQNAPASGLGVVFTGAPGTYDFAIAFNNNSSTADLVIDPSGPGTFTFSNISVASGYTLKVRNNSATHAITVAIPAGITSSTSTAGGTITVSTPSPPLLVTALTLDQDPIAGAAVYLETFPGGTQVLNGETDSSGEVSGSYSGSVPQAVIGWVRSGSGSIAYVDYPLGGSITSSGYSQTAILQEDQ